MRRKYNLVIRYFCLFLTLLLTGTSTSVLALNFPAGKEDLYIQNNILFYEPGVETNNFNNPSYYSGINVPCLDGEEELWPNKGYNVTDDDLRGLLRMAIAENGEGGLKFELSLMANLYEYKDALSTWGDTLPQYISNPTTKYGGHGWFATFPAFKDTDYTNSEYQDNYSRAIVERNLSLARDIIVNGNRRIPQEINEHDCIWCGEKYGFNVYTIQTGDVIYTHTANPEQVKDRKNYIRGQTIITNMKGSKYLFYGFPKTDSKGNPAGDPFGSKNLNADFTTPCSSNSSVIIGNIDYSAYSEYDESNYAQFDFNQNYTTTEKQKRFKFLFEGATVQIDSKFHAFLNGVECRQHESDGANCSSNLKALTESITVPQCGQIRVHKKLSGIFKQILNIIAYQTTFKIYTCTTNWEYRDFTSDPHLSHHAFGSAIDINSNDNPWYSWSCNQYPAESGVVCYDTRNPKAVPEEIGNIFRKFGFKWHNWLETYNGKQIPRDPMHFSWTFN